MSAGCVREPELNMTEPMIIARRLGLLWLVVAATMPQSETLLVEKLLRLALWNRSYGELCHLSDVASAETGKRWHKWEVRLGFLRSSLDLRSNLKVQNST